MGISVALGSVRAFWWAASAFQQFGSGDVRHFFQSKGTAGLGLGALVVFTFIVFTLGSFFFGSFFFLGSFTFLVGGALGIFLGFGALVALTFFGLDFPQSGTFTRRVYWGWEGQSKSTTLTRRRATPTMVLAEDRRRRGNVSGGGATRGTCSC